MIIVSFSDEFKRSVYTNEGPELMVHSLKACDYLKVEPTNLLKFSRPKQGMTNRVLSIKQQQLDMEGNCYLDDVYSVNFEKMTLREAIVMQSIFRCETVVEISNIISI